MVTIELLQLKFHAYHGVWEGEAILGGPFEVSLSVSYEEPSTGFQNLSDTVNYATLFEIIDCSMRKTRPLIETVAAEIITLSKQKFACIRLATCGVYKLNPPVGRFEGKLGITIKREFHD